MQPAGIEVLGDAQCVGHLTRRLRDVRADGDCPVGQLIPRQEVSRERQPECRHEQRQADQPVELARLSVRGRIEGARHVEDHRDHHHVSGPAVDVPHEAAGRHHEVDVLDRLVGDVGVGLVIEHQQHAGHERDEKRRHARNPEARGRRPAQAPAVRAHRVEMKEDVAEDKRRAAAIGRRRPGAERGPRQPPRCGPQVVPELPQRGAWNDKAHVVTRVPGGTVAP